MITPKQLEDQGYNRSRSSHYDVLYNTDTLYQKRIRNLNGTTLYFINCWYYPRQSLYGGAIMDEQFSVEATLYFGEDQSMHLSFPSKGYDNIVHIESLIERVFKSMGCTPDPHN